MIVLSNALKGVMKKIWAMECVTQLVGMKRAIGTIQTASAPLSSTLLRADPLTELLKMR